MEALSMKFGEGGPSPEETTKILETLEGLAREGENGVVLQLLNIDGTPYPQDLFAAGFRLAQYRDTFRVTIPGKGTREIYDEGLTVIECVAKREDLESEEGQQSFLKPELLIRFDLDPVKRSISYSYRQEPLPGLETNPLREIEVEYRYETV